MRCFLFQISMILGRGGGSLQENNCSWSRVLWCKMQQNVMWSKKILRLQLCPTSKQSSAHQASSLPPIWKRTFLDQNLIWLSRHPVFATTIFEEGGGQSYWGATETWSELQENKKKRPEKQWLHNSYEKQEHWHSQDIRQWLPER